MLEHAGYWKGLAERLRHRLRSGPGSGRSLGVAVVEVESEAQVRELIAGDPVALAGLGTFQVYPLRIGAMRSSRMEQAT